jgi:hypothetical protein
VSQETLNEIRPDVGMIRRWERKSWAGSAGNVRGLLNAVNQSLDIRLMDRQPGDARSKPAEAVRRGRPVGRIIPDEKLIGYLEQAREARWSWVQLKTALAKSAGAETYSSSDSLGKRISRIENPDARGTAKRLWKELAIRYDFRVR